MSDPYALASRQHGVITFRQLRDAGVSESTITRSIRSGRLVPFEPGTYLIAGSPATWDQRAMASALAVGPLAAVSHLGAAALLDLGTKPPSQIHVTAPHGTHDGRWLGAGVVHRARTLGLDDIRRIRGIPVTCPERTLVDLAGVIAPARLASLLDNALLRGVTTLEAIRSYVVDRRLAHRKGVGRLAELMQDREAGVPESELERRFLQVVDRFALPAPVRQAVVGPYRVDFAYLDVRVLVELDGRTFHGTAEAFEEDITRQNALTLGGWRTVLRFTWRHLTKEARYVAETLGAAIAPPPLALSIR